MNTDPQFDKLIAILNNALQKDFDVVVNPKLKKELKSFLDEFETEIRDDQYHLTARDYQYGNSNLF